MQRLMLLYYRAVARTTVAVYADICCCEHAINAVTLTNVCAHTTRSQEDLCTIMIALAYTQSKVMKAVVIELVS
jgi:hypothetical protein